MQKKIHLHHMIVNVPGKSLILSSGTADVVFSIIYPFLNIFSYSFIKVQCISISSGSGGIVGKVKLSGFIGSLSFNFLTKNNAYYHV